MSGQGTPASSVRPPASPEGTWHTGSPHVKYHLSPVPPELDEPEEPDAEPPELDVLCESGAASLAGATGGSLVQPVTDGAAAAATEATNATTEEFLFTMESLPCRPA